MSVQLTNYKALALRLLKPNPSPFPMIRIGGNQDGAYLVPDDLDGVTACFSPGVCNSKAFEDELSLSYGIRCHLCDYSADSNLLGTSLIEGLQTFDKLWLDVKCTHVSIDLCTWLCNYTSLSENNLLLQMDIEGSEYRNLFYTSISTINRFRVIVIELHRLDKLQVSGWLFNLLTICSLLWHKLLPNIRFLEKNVWMARGLRTVSRKLEPFLLAPILVKLSQTHSCIHAHPNNCIGEFIEPTTKMNIPRVIELTLLRRDRYSCDSNALLQPKLPHPLDIHANVTSRPPLILNKFWLY